MMKVAESVVPSEPLQTLGVRRRVAPTVTVGRALSLVHINMHPPLLGKESFFSLKVLLTAEKCMRGLPGEGFPCFPPGGISLCPAGNLWI